MNDLNTYYKLIGQLNAVRDLAGLQQYTTSLYNSGLLDNAANGVYEGPEGPVAPWSYNGTLVWSDDNDMLVRTVSGELALWNHEQGQWQPGANHAPAVQEMLQIARALCSEFRRLHPGDISPTSNYIDDVDRERLIITIRYFWGGGNMSQPAKEYTLEQARNELSRLHTKADGSGTSG